MRNQILGRQGEQVAVDFLQRQGYGICARNFRVPVGEIDIIARKGSFIVFVEVKLRKNTDHGEAREFVTYAKQRRVICAAEYWLVKNNCELQPRFDVMEIYAPEGTGTLRPKIRHLENAFSY